MDRTDSKKRQTPYCSHSGATVSRRAASLFAPGAPTPTKRAMAMQIQAGTVMDAGMSDQPIDPLGENPRTWSRMDVASPGVAECQNIVERLRSV